MILDPIILKRLQKLVIHSNERKLVIEINSLKERKKNSSNWRRPLTHKTNEHTKKMKNIHNLENPIIHITYTLIYSEVHSTIFSPPKILTSFCPSLWLLSKWKLHEKKNLGDSIKCLKCFIFFNWYSVLQTNKILADFKIETELPTDNL